MSSQKGTRPCPCDSFPFLSLISLFYLWPTPYSLIKKQFMYQSCPRGWIRDALSQNIFTLATVATLDDQLRRFIALVIRPPWGGFDMSRVSCYHRPSLYSWFYLLCARNSGENPGQTFHARTNYGTCHGALGMGNRTASPSGSLDQGTSNRGYGL